MSEHDYRFRNTSGTTSSPPRILFVDDTQDILDLYDVSLSDVYQVITVSRGRDAIDRVKNGHEFDAAVIDYRLPDISGIEVMKEIKDIFPSLPVIIATAYGDEEVAVTAFRSGARDYLKKPFNMSELCAKLDFFLALRHADKLSRKNVVFERTDKQVTEKTTDPVSFRQYHRIQAAVRYINDNYRNEIRLEDVAKETAMSPAHLSRIFRKVMGLSYQEYINSRRITKAQNLLRTSAQSATEIAFSLGFSDVTGFGRLFKKLTGYTPSAFRNLPKK